MLKWEIINNTISKLYYQHHNIIYPWGVETADSSSFFSLEEGIGWRYQALNQKFKYDDQTFSANLETKMKEGHWRLQVADNIIDDQTIFRKAEAICLQDSYFMDFVMRFRFQKQFIEYAEIAGNRYFHNDTNVYNQYPVDQVILKGKNFTAQISIIDLTVPEKMRPYMYVRDTKNEWVIHLRMLPQKWDKEVIKVCNRWAGTRPLPMWITRPILKFQSVKNHLWYRSEVKPFKNPFLKRLNLNAFPMILLPKGERLMWKVKFHIR